MNQQSDMTAADAKRLFMDFISDLQGIPCGFRIGEIHNGFRAYDSRTGAEIEALPLFATFHEARISRGTRSGQKWRRCGCSGCRMSLASRLA